GCRIQGKVRLSMDSACDEDDTVFQGLHFNVVLNDNVEGIAVSNHQGDYFIPLDCDTSDMNLNYTISPFTELLNYFDVSPTSVEINFPGSPGQTFQDFCITPNGVHPDAEIIVSPVNEAIPGFTASYKMVIKNKGTTVLEGSSLLTYPAALMNYQEASVVPASSTPGALSWNYSDLMPFETRTITVSFLLNTPMDTPALNGGDVLTLQGQVTTLATDVSPSDNSFTLQQTVVNSFDPNDKTCLQGDLVSETLIGEYVHYLIRFENTGTFFAQNVVISDYIDLDSFELNSLMVLDASHTQWTRIIENKVEFIFENIQLPFPPSEERHGYVLFKIKLKNTLSVGDSFSNTASIFFDFNFPIVTEEAVTHIEALDVSDFEFSNYIQLYPVPTKDYMQFKSNSLLVNKIFIYNTQGQLAMVFMTPNSEQPLEISSLPAGTYFVRFETDQGVSTGKMIKL
ncbi:MAG: T9SS type A sorting domain-containing protein, partial [Flavobacterium sp.]